MAGMWFRLACLCLLLAGGAPAATLVTAASGNFSASATWHTTDTNASLDSEASTYTVSTANLDSATFVPAASAKYGVVLFVSSRTSTGTFTVTLRNSTTATNAQSVTVNLTDMPNNGPAFFKFGSAHTPNGTNSYLIRVVCSNTNCITLFRNATANNASRELVNSATASPAANDRLLILGEMTGAGTSNSFTVTMNLADGCATSFGSVSLTSSLSVGKGGTLQYSTTGSSTYCLQIKGLVRVHDGGTWTQDSSGSSSRVVQLKFNPTANVDSGYRCENGGTCTIKGASVSSVSTLLTADLAAAQTSVTVGSTAGWSNGGVIAIAPTTRTASQAESLTISTVNSATNVTTTAGAANDHSGTSPTQAEVIYLTRNAQVFGASTSLQMFMLLNTGAVAVLDYVEMYNLGSSTAGKRGLDIQTTTGSASITNCSLHDGVAAGSGALVLTGNVANITMTGNVVYNIARTLFSIPATAASTGTITFTNNTFIRTTDSANSCAAISEGTGNGGVLAAVSGLRVSGCAGNGPSWNATAPETVTGSGIVIHSINGAGLIQTTDAGWGSSLTNVSVWRCTGDGIGLGNVTPNMSGFTFDSLTIFGNGGDGLNFTGGDLGRITIRNSTFAGDTSFSQCCGLRFDVGVDLYLENTTFGVASGIFVAHTTADLTFFSNRIVQIHGSKVTLASSTPIESTFYSNVAGSFIGISQYGGSTKAHRYFTARYTVQYDETTVRGSLPSQRVTPNNSAGNNQKPAPSESGPWKVAVPAGGTASTSVWVRKSVSTDSCGQDYAGNNLRLIARANPGLGVSQDTVIASESSAIGNWVQLSGSIATSGDAGAVEFLVDGGGTSSLAGCFYVESGPYWYQGLPAPVGARITKPATLDLNSFN
jgi:hypothetical protein